MQRRVGGRRLALGAAATLLAVIAALSAAGSARAAGSNRLQYYGGPVAHSMRVVVVPWGPEVRSAYTDPSSGDPAFFSYLASQNGSTADLGGVLAQYMDSSGGNSQNSISYGGAVQISPSVGATPSAPPSTSQDYVYDSNIQTELTNDIDAGTLPSPSGNGLSTVYVVLLPPNDTVCQGSGCSSDAKGFCAYHGSFALPSGTQVLYAAMVDNGPGTPNYGACGNNSNDVANQTSIVSHEVGETINDPLAAEATSTYLGPPLAWYDNPDNSELADLCLDDQAANGTWTVQKIWSNLDSACVASEPAYAAPTASFQAFATAVPGQQVSFDGSGSSDPTANTAAAEYLGTSYSIRSGIVHYAWDWGDGTITSSSTPTATHTYATPGTYQVSLTVTDRLGFTSTVTHQISIAARGNPQSTTGAATDISRTGATLNGTVNPESQSVQYRFVYGRSPALTQSTTWTAGPAGASSSAVSATVSQLSPATKYYYRLDVLAGGVTYSGSVASFSTSAAASSTQRPTVATGSASGIGTSGAVLNATINPGGPSPVGYHFAYGTSASRLSSSTPSRTVAGTTSAISVSAPVKGLRSGVRYYYRVLARLSGHPYFGALRSFVTRRSLPHASTGGASKVTSSEATVSGAVNPNGLYTTYLVEFGQSTAYGHSTVASKAGSGRSAVPIHLLLSGLRSNTTYHYRVVASSAGGTAVGGDRTFKTLAPPRPAPRFSFKVAGHLSLVGALAHGIKVPLTCSEACLARFTARVAPSRRPAQRGMVTLTVAEGSGRTQANAWSTATLSFPARMRTRLRRAHGVSLVISGYAVSPGSAPTRHIRVRLTLK